MKWFAPAFGLVAFAVACSSPDPGGHPRLGSRAAEGDPAAGAASPTTPSAPSSATVTATAPPPPPPPADPCAGRRVCDSFESYADGAPPAGTWKASTSDGAVTVTTERAYRGTHAVKLTTNATTYQRAFLQTAQVASGTLYGRMMVWLEQPAANGVHWTMLSGDGAVPGHDGVRAFYRYGGQWGGKLMANYDTSGASTDCWQHSQTAMPIQKWTCVTFRLDGAASTMDLALDGAPVSDLHIAGAGQGCLGHDLGDQWIGPAFTSASLGWESYQPDVGHTMYLDDVVLDAAPVACP